MEVINKLVNKGEISAALGFFDGVHIAHQRLISNAVLCAKKNNIKSAVITFQKSPYSIITGTEPSYITDLKTKVEHIEKLGVDYLYLLDFNEFKNLSAKEYIQNILIDSLCTKFIFTGFNHTFGANKGGNSNLLKNFSNFYKYFELPKIELDKIVISSTNIRKFILDGNFSSANKMLGYNFFVSGEVISGNQIARKLGFKTANIIFPNLIVKPKYGVYFGYVTHKNRRFPALINFGVRPSVDKTLTETLEAHILNFDENIYGDEIQVEFVSKIRDEMKFNSYEELKLQIEKDYNSITL